ncbi:MAG: hypothetical protein PWR01_670, partial [Clostridiales bacterium]|nr:hypothetical protein [Clostridiales bacterium]
MSKIAGINYHIKMYIKIKTFIGALRTNRVIYPKGHGSLGIKVHAFAKTLTAKDVSLVKAGGHEYYIYTYQGK